LRAACDRLRAAQRRTSKLHDFHDDAPFAGRVLAEESVPNSPGNKKDSSRKDHAGTKQSPVTNAGRNERNCRVPRRAVKRGHAPGVMLERKLSYGLAVREQDVVVPGDSFRKPFFHRMELK